MMHNNTCSKYSVISFARIFLTVCFINSIRQNFPMYGTLNYCAYIIKSSVDCDLLQEDLNSVYFWSDRWQLRLSPPKCEALSITNKRCPITTTYTVNGVPLRWSTSVRYLGLHITSNLCWSKHCVIIAAKATKCLNYLRHTLWGATPQVNSLAFRCVVRPIMEYGCQLWNPFTQKDIQLLETIQRRAACWVCGSLCFFLDQIF